MRMLLVTVSITETPEPNKVDVTEAHVNYINPVFIVTHTTTYKDT